MNANDLMCRNEHLRTAQNTSLRISGERECRDCMRAASARRRASKPVTVATMTSEQLERKRERDRKPRDRSMRNLDPAQRASKLLVESERTWRSACGFYRRWCDQQGIA